jgi:RNA polymerase sigma-70 factor (ECF subfamily)
MAHETVDAATIAAFQSGDADAFTRIAKCHGRELHVHCYRMIGSIDDADDLVQETLMRAWTRRASYEGRAGVRAWLYRIATNACIDFVRARAARPAGHDDERGAPSYTRFPWMQPYPDALLEAPVSDRELPDLQTVTRDTIELAFLATIQTLPAKQRAVFLLRDVLDFSAAETAMVLDDTTAAVNSALQRARASLDRRRDAAGDAVARSVTSFDEQVLVQRWMDAQDRGDVAAIVDLLRDDVRMTLFPDATTWDGREEVARELRSKRADFDGDVRSIPIAANRQPAVAVYIRQRHDTAFRAWAVILLGVREGKLREIATFASPELFSRFALPPILPEEASATA